MRIIEELRELAAGPVVSKGVLERPAYATVYRHTLCEFIHAFETGIDPNSTLLRPRGNNVRKALLNALDELVRTGPVLHHDHSRAAGTIARQWDRSAWLAALALARDTLQQLSEVDHLKQGCETSVIASRSAINAIASTLLSISGGLDIPDPGSRSAFAGAAP
ncbi:hypothetical protein [Agrobacterium sp. B1(2019)]|uniref:hypothetical protein n=1 Tax=Agrobacterium sp. B1(2019) TaxID=2607032 RepID=UPI0011ED5AF6|nr:hypothetical protein [Agrobacterium sp. B1(2019)]TZG36572.1 hypothetical protein AGR1_03475 [Agrobacterium sp. B1(2019)]